MIYNCYDRLKFSYNFASVLGSDFGIKFCQIFKTGDRIRFCVNSERIVFSFFVRFNKIAFSAKCYNFSFNSSLFIITLFSNAVSHIVICVLVGAIFKTIKELLLIIEQMNDQSTKSAVIRPSVRCTGKRVLYGDTSVRFYFPIPPFFRIFLCPSVHPTISFQFLRDIEYSLARLVLN